MSFSVIKRNLFWLNDFIHGGIIRSFYNELALVNRNYEQGYTIQQESLKRILEHAKTNSEFYAKHTNVGGGKITDYPVTNKYILSQNHDSVCIPSEKIPGQKDIPIHVQRTSGSTGTPFAVPQDVLKRKRRIAELKYYNAELGVLSHDMIGQCRVWTKWHSKSKWQSFRENIIPINVARMDDETCALLFSLVKENRIVLLRAYASWYDAVVNYMKSGKGKPEDLKTLRVCISSSEALNEETREGMMSLTGIPIVEAYADEEAGVMAQQRIGDTNYYLNHADYVFEFLKLDDDSPAEEGELSRIVITDLFNYAFPLIRYDTGDTAVFHRGNESSFGWTYITSLYGRRLDLVYDTDGRPVHPMSFARILKNIPGIIQWQLIQKDEKKYTVRLNMKEENSIDETLDEIRSVLGSDSEITTEYVNDIPVLASGKRKPVVCEWKR